MHGPDMAGIFIGDGGIYGIKVEATFRMFRLPKFEIGGARCWDTLDEAFAAYNELWGIDPTLYMQPYAVGMLLSPEFVNIVTQGQGKPQWVLMFLSVGNTQEEVDLKHKATDEICTKHGGELPDPAVMGVAQNFTHFTHGMSKFATFGSVPLFELILPRSQILESYKWTREYLFSSLEKNGIDKNKLAMISGVLSSGTGMGMTTIVPFTPENDQELRDKMLAIMVEYLEQAQRRGYVLEATQGHEASLKAKGWTPEFYDFCLTMKEHLDPNNIMNPGVFFA